jgi:2-phospho-L-lactate guanylyltransferase
MRGEGISSEPAVTLVPSRDGDGTNAILAAPPDAFTPRFGPGSFARHLAQAARQGSVCHTIKLPGLGLDIDEAADLTELMRRVCGNPRYAFLDDDAFLPAGAATP